MTTQQKDSPALQLVRLVFTEGQKATGHSWTRLNQALYQAAKVAIEGGLRFDLEDFTSFYAKMRAEYWIGAHPDGLYAAACKVGNLSACRAYEHHYGFCPYELDGQRVFVGHDFMWKGERVTCTSIHKDHLVACSYGPQGEAPSYQRKVKHRYKITHDQILAVDKARAAHKADGKMTEARNRAREYARQYNIPEETLGLCVANHVELAGLDAYEKERLNWIMGKRFKKSDKPTVLDLLTVGYRWSLDQVLIKRVVDKIVYPLKRLHVEPDKKR